MPGTGEFTSQFLSYTYAQKTSKDPDKFGDGSPEGLVASEAANNAVPGAAMIPLLALGIPGEALTAMMLSVFYVHNVIPGPQLFESQMDFVMALYMALILLNVIVMVFSAVLNQFPAQDHPDPDQVPRYHDPDPVLCWRIFAAQLDHRLRTGCRFRLSSASYSNGLDLPIVPIILGMVLGGIMEVKLRSAMARVKSPLDFIDRPIAAILFGLIVLILILHLRTLYFEYRNKQRPEPVGDPVDPNHPSQQG